MPTNNLPTASVFDLSFVASDLGKTTDYFMEHVERGKGLKTVFTPNPEIMMRAWRENDFMSILRAGGVLLPDGNGIVWASKVLAKKNSTKGELKLKTLSNRITGADAVEDLLKKIYQNSDKSIKVLLIGGFDYQNVQASKYPGVARLKVKDVQSDIYWWQNYQNSTNASENQEKRVQKLISELKPNIVFVGLGAPTQEKWIAAHKDFLEKNGVKLAMAVGGTFDFLTGKLRRAPKKWQKWRLEWLYRLAQEPSRLKRQLVLPHFVLKVLFTEVISYF